MVRQGRQKGALKLPRARQSRLIGIAFSYCSARYRLGAMRADDRIARLIAARAKLRREAAADERFAPFDEAAFHPAFTVAENIFFGPVRTGRRDSRQPFEARADALVAEMGLRGLILRAGVDQPVGEGGATLNALQRRKLGLARALMKKPGAMLVDQIAQTESGPDQALRALLHRELQGGALVWTASREEQAPDADHLILIDAEGRATQRPGPQAAGPPGPGAVDGGSDEGG